MQKCTMNGFAVTVAKMLVFDFFFRTVFVSEKINKLNDY